MLVRLTTFVYRVHFRTGHVPSAMTANTCPVQTERRADRQKGKPVQPPHKPRPASSLPVSPHTTFPTPPPASTWPCCGLLPPLPASLLPPHSPPCHLTTSLFSVSRLHCSLLPFLFNQLFFPYLVIASAVGYEQAGTINWLCSPSRLTASKE